MLTALVFLFYNYFLGYDFNFRYIFRTINLIVSTHPQASFVLWGMHITMQNDREYIYHLTHDGVSRFTSELKALQELRVQQAREEAGEDNADLDLTDRKIGEFVQILQSYELITPPPPRERDVVGLGAVVTVETGGRVNEFTVVGTLEANPLAGKVSNESPVGRALCGKKVGDRVLVYASAKITYIIKDVRYAIKRKTTG